MLLPRSSSISHFAALLVLVTLACCPTAVSAADRFQPISAEDLAMKSEPLAPGAPAIILFRQVERDDNGTPSAPRHEDNYVRIKILTEEGRKYAHVEIPFVKPSENVVNLKARAIRPDGSVVNFDGKVVEKSLSQERGVTHAAKTFTLHDVQVGGIIEYYYTYNYGEGTTYESHWILSQELFTRDAKFLLKTYNPPDGTVTVGCSWRLLPPGTTPPREDKNHIIRLETRNVPAFQKEDFMPPEDEIKSRVDFAYSYDPPEPDKDKYWRAVAKKGNDELERFINKREAMQPAVTQIVSAGDSPELKLQKIYARVQQMRNTSYEVSTTHEEAKGDNSKPIKNVEDVWKRGYGNFVELTWLYLALVRAAGFVAYGVWISDRMNYFFDPVERQSYKLDVNAVLIKLNGKDIYCAPGEKFAPFGLLPWTDAGVAGLRLDNQGGSWIRTPLPPSSVSRTERKADLQLSAAGDLQGTLTVTFTGLEAIDRRTEARNEDEAGRKKYLEDDVKRYVPATSQVELTNQPKWSDPAVPLVAEFHLKISGWASATGHRVVVPVGLFNRNHQHLFDRAERRVNPIYIEFPFQTIDEIVMEIPSGWQVSGLPPVQHQDGQAMSYSMKVENDKRKVHLTRILDANFLILQPQEYPALRNFFQQVRTADEQQIILQSGAVTASK